MKTEPFILLAPPGVQGAEHAAALAARWQVPYVSMAALLPAATDPAPATSSSEAVAHPVSDELAL